MCKANLGTVAPRTAAHLRLASPAKPFLPFLPAVSDCARPAERRSINMHVTEALEHIRDGCKTMDLGAYAYFMTLQTCMWMAPAFPAGIDGLNMHAPTNKELQELGAALASNTTLTSLSLRGVCNGIPSHPRRRRTQIACGKRAARRPTASAPRVPQTVKSAPKEPSSCALGSRVTRPSPRWTFVVRGPWSGTLPPLGAVARVRVRGHESGTHPTHSLCHGAPTPADRREPNWRRGGEEAGRRTEGQQNPHLTKSSRCVQRHSLTHPLHVFVSPRRECVSRRQRNRRRWSRGAGCRARG